MRQVRHSLGLTLLLAGCSVDVGTVPEDAQVSCTADRDCPGELICNRNLGLCRTTLESLPPVVSISVPQPAAQQRWVATIPIELSHSDPNGMPFGNDRLTLAVEYSLDGGNWCAATQIAESLVDVETSRDSEVLQVTWNASAEQQSGACDLRPRPVDSDGDGLPESGGDVLAFQTLELRAEASDTAGKVSVSAPVELLVGNQPPSTTLAITSGTYSGLVPIPFSFSNDPGDLSSLEVEYSLDAGVTFQQATLAGPQQQLASSIDYVVVWNSVAADGIGAVDLAGVVLRTRGFDAIGAGRDYGAWDTVAGIDIDNQTPPVADSITVRTVGAGLTGSVTLQYVLFDGESDPADVLVEFSRDGGHSWLPCTEMPDVLSQGRYDLATAPRTSRGRTHFFSWDVISDIALASNPIAVRVTPADSDAIGSPAMASLNATLGSQPGTSFAGFVEVAGVDLSGMPGPVLMRDLNGDDVPEVIAPNGSNVTRLNLLSGHGIGLGIFGSTADTAVASPVRALSMADFNGDTVDDLAVHTQSSGTVIYLTEPSDGAWNQSDTLATASGLDHVFAAGDFDGDGEIDLVESGTTLRLWLGAGDGSFALDNNSYTLSDVGFRVAAADVNGDGCDDAIVAVRSIPPPIGEGTGIAIYAGAEVQVWAGQQRSVATDPALAFAQVAANELGFFEQTDAPPYPLRYGLDLTAADLDADGSAEVVVLSSYYVSEAQLDLIVYGWPPAQWQLDRVPSDPSLSFRTAVAAPDLDGDGLPDLVALAHGVLHLYLNSGSSLGTVDALGAVAASAPIQGFSARDWNADGVADMVANTNDDRLVTLVPSRSGVTVSSSLAIPAEVHPVASATEIRVRDVNADRAPDVVVRDATNLTVSQLFGQVDGLLGTLALENVGTSGMFPSGGSIYASLNDSTLADVNGDGLLDVVLVDFDGRIYVTLAQTADGLATGAWETPFSPPDAAAAYVATLYGAGDFNQDGFDDLVSYQGGIRIFLSRQSAGVWQSDFDALPAEPIGGTPSHLATGDFDGDSNLDLFVGGSTRLVILLGNGDGSFAAPCTTDFGAGNTVRRVASADVDDDGEADVLVAVGGSGTVGSSVRRLQRSGTGCNSSVAAIGPYAASAPTGITGSSSTTDLLVAELDGDGIQDVLVAANGAWVWRGESVGDRAIGSFAAPVLVSPFGELLHAGDFNSDGLTDLVTALPGELSIALGLRQSRWNSWVVPLTAAETVGEVLRTGRDRFGAPYEHALTLRPFGGGEPARGGIDAGGSFLAQWRLSGMAAAATTAQAFSRAWEIGGGNHWVPSLSEGRWRAVSRFAAGAGLDLSASPPRGVIARLPLMRLVASAIDFAGAPPAMVVVARWQRPMSAAEWVGDAGYGDPTLASALPRAADATGDPYAVWWPLSEWEVLPEDDGFASGTGRRWSLDTSGPVPEVHVLTDRFGVVQVFARR